MSQSNELMENIEGNSENFTFKYSLKYSLYKDEQLEIFQEGVNIYYWVLFNIVTLIVFLGIFIGLLIPDAIGLIINLINLNFLDSDFFFVLIKLLAFLVIECLILYVGLIPFFKLYLFQSSDLSRFFFKVQTKEQLRDLVSSVSIKLDSREINIPITKLHERKISGFYQYSFYSVRITPSLNKQMNLTIGSKTIPLFLSLKDPAGGKTRQYPTALIFLVKDLTFL